MSLATNPLTAAYRQVIATITAGGQLNLRNAWASLFDADDPINSLARVGVAARGIIEVGQAATSAETVGWLGRLLRQAGTNGGPIKAPDLVGTTAAGRGLGVGGLTGQAPGVYRRQLDIYKDTPERAAEVTQGWLNAITGSEPVRVANAVTLDVAVHDPRFTGRVDRITRPDACEWCKKIADRGYIPGHHLFLAHPHCRCNPEPELTVIHDPNAVPWYRR